MEPESSMAMAMTTEVAMGSLAGLVSGYTLKKLGQLVSLGLLAGYSCLQLAKMRGLVQEHQLEALSNSIKSLLERGQVFFRTSSPELHNYLQSLTQFGVPSIISFGGGFYVGFFYS